MIKSLKVTNPNGEYILLTLVSPEQSGLIVRGIDGLGPPKSTVNITESLYQDGGYFNSARNLSRNIIIGLQFLDSPGIETIEEIRNKTYRFFPTKSKLTLEVETDSRVAVANGYVESNEPNIFSKEETTLISIICPDPNFYEKGIVTTVFSGVQDGFEFPWENPSTTQSLIEFGSVFINTAASVFYTGDVSVGVTITIIFLGAVTDPIIHNLNTGKNMALSSTKLAALTGSNFQAGDVVTISTVRGNKSIKLVRAGTTWNILNAVDTLADWFQLTRGENVFTYTATSGLSNMQLSISHKIGYEGV